MRQKFLPVWVLLRKVLSVGKSGSLFCSNRSKAVLLLLHLHFEGVVYEIFVISRKL